MILSLCGQVAPQLDNYGYVYNPQIDATIVVNYGTIEVNTVSRQPFSTQNTLFFTNQPSAKMTGRAGFRFDYVSDIKQLPLDSFVNRGVIAAEGEGVLMVLATNLVSSGLLSAPPNGWIFLEGASVNLVRGGLRTGEDPAAGSQSQRGYMTETNFVNSAGVADGMWGIGTNTINLPVVAASIQGYQPFVYSNPPGESNQLIQIVLVNTNSLPPGLTVQAGFVNPNQFENGYVPSQDLIRTDDPQAGQIAIVRLLMSTVDAATGLPSTNILSLLDYSAILKTNLVLLTNVNQVYSYRPSAFEVMRGTPYEWNFARPSNAPFIATLIYGPDSPAPTVDGVITADYVAVISSLGNTPRYPTGSGSAILPEFSNPTNLPGRIEVKSESLDLSMTRVHSEGLLTLQTGHLLGNKGAVLDAPLIRFDLASTNGLLIVSNLVLDTIQRLSGSVQASSRLYSVSASNTVTGTTSDLRFHLLVVTPTLQTTQPVELYSFNLRGTNVVVADRLIVGRSLFLEAENLAITGSLTTLDNDLGCLAYTNLPGLKTLTNTGTIHLANVGNFGDSGAHRAQVIANSGLMTGQALGVWTQMFENSRGGIVAASGGSVILDTLVAKIDDGQITALGDINLSAGDLKTRRSTISSGAALNLAITNRLTDGGPGASNLWQCADGFRLYFRPSAGDLLGTHLVTLATNFTEVRHIWGAEDRGPNGLGFSNNMAIGVLTIDAGPFNVLRFSGALSNSAMYVDYLELRNWTTNYVDVLRIDPNLVIYFAAANLPVEQLDGQMNGRLRWVRDFAGPNSATTVVLPSGQVIQVNQGLRQSLILDSDADGVVNGLDPSPFDGVVITRLVVTQRPAPTALISWQAAASTIYRLEYATKLIKPDWQFLMYCPNQAYTNWVMTVPDIVPPAESQRYYRVSYQP